MKELFCQLKDQILADLCCGMEKQTGRMPTQQDVKRLENSISDEAIQERCEDYIDQAARMLEDT